MASTFGLKSVVAIRLSASSLVPDSTGPVRERQTPVVAQRWWAPEPIDSLRETR